MLEKVDGFAGLEIPDLETGNLDKITVRIESNLATQAKDVLSGDLDYMQDPPPPDLLSRIREEASDRFAEEPAGAVSYLFLNTEEPPFDDERVRQAAAFALDRPGIARLYGGLMAPTCNMSAPVVPGYEELNPCPYGDPDEPPDLDRARELIDQAGAEGAEVEVWGPAEGQPAEGDGRDRRSAQPDRARSQAPPGRLRRLHPGHRRCLDPRTGGGD